MPKDEILVYVAGFGLERDLLERHPELVASRAGLGLSQRIAEALFDSRRLRFFEEKAAIVDRLTSLLRGDTEDPGTAPRQRPDWLLYGELIAVETSRRETVAGLRADTQIETRVTVQIRLVERSSGRVIPVTAAGSALGRPDAEGDPLNAADVAIATGEAVRQAAKSLLERLAVSR